MKKNNLLLWLVVAVLGFTLLGSLGSGVVGKTNLISLSQFMSIIDKNQIEKVNVLNETVIGTTKDGIRFKTFFPASYV
ncbi:MAG: hypothetical protein RL208_104, partial [Pseudomonadota bacterium]